MLIIEGPDGVGKTTLAKKLLAELPTHIYVHFTRLPWQFDYYWGYADRVSRNIVQDRFHLSEIVYAATRGEPSPLDPEGYRLVDAKVRLAGGFTVLITADEGLIRSRWDPTQMYNLDKTLAAARLFDEVRLGVSGGQSAFLSDYAPDANFVPDVDYTWHCSKEIPYVTDNAVREIIDQYRDRLATVDRIAGRRTSPL